MMKIRFRSEKAESAWITAVQMYPADREGKRLLRYPLIADQQICCQNSDNVI